MFTMFSDADFRWSNGFLIRCILVNLRQFFQINVVAYMKKSRKVILRPLAIRVKPEGFPSMVPPIFF